MMHEQVVNLPDGRSYKLPDPVELPDLNDPRVLAAQLAEARYVVRETRKQRRLYWLHQIFPWL